jgi:hypothetical protein
VCYENDSEELAKALSKFFTDTNLQDGAIYVNSAENFIIYSNGIEASYQNYTDNDSDCDYLLNGGSNEECPYDFEAYYDLESVLSHFDVDIHHNKKYIFENGVQRQKNEYVETTDYMLYDVHDITKVTALSYEKNFFDNTKYYSREQVCENSDEGIEYLKFNYPSLAKAVLKAIKDTDTWQDGTVVDINHEDEFSATFNQKYTLHAYSNGDIKISKEYPTDGLSLKNTSLKEIFEKHLKIHPRNVASMVVLRNRTTLETEDIYINRGAKRSANNRYFILNSSDVKPIGYLKSFNPETDMYIVYNGSNIMDVFYEEEFEKFLKDNNLNNVLDENYEETSTSKLYQKDEDTPKYTVKRTCIFTLMEENPGDTRLECGSTD